VFKSNDTQGIFSKNLVDDSRNNWFNAFLIDRQAQGVSKGTLHFYEVKVKSFINYFESQQVTNTAQITPNVLRDYLLYLGSTGHNPGGRHAHFRAIR
jgi:site-specific recombinase XerD